MISARTAAAAFGGLADESDIAAAARVSHPQRLPYESRDRMRYLKDERWVSSKVLS